MKKVIKEPTREIPSSGKCGVLVVGGGPAAGTAAALAVQQCTLPGDIDVELLRNQLGVDNVIL